MKKIMSDCENDNLIFEDVSDGEFIDDVDEELDKIAAELSKLKQRLDACLKSKQKNLLSKIKQLNEQIQVEREAAELARFQELNELGKHCDEDSPMEMTKKSPKYSSQKGSNFTQYLTPRKESDAKPRAKRRELNGNHESSKRGSKSSTPSASSSGEKTTRKGTDSEVIAKRHEKRQINGNHESGKKSLESSQFSTPFKELDSKVLSKRYEEQDINGNRESGKKDEKSSPFSTSSKETNSISIAKTHEKQKLKGNLPNALKTIRRNDKISKNFPNEAKNQYKLLLKLKRKERQMEIEMDMKGELMPYFRACQITRQHYKDILRTCMKKALLMEKMSSCEIRKMIRNQVKKIHEK